MKASDLLNYVSKAAAVSNSSALVPLAKNILFSSTPNGPNTVLKATDFETSIIVNVPEMPAPEVPFGIDAQKIVQVLKALKNENINYDYSGASFKITTLGGNYELPKMDADGFPDIVVEQGENIAPSYIFEHVLDLTKGSVSNDEMRPSMTGVYFDTKLGNVVSTNGHKLTKYKANFQGESFILPTKAAELFKSDEKFYYKSTDNAIHFKSDSGAVDFRLTKINGQYPPYDKVIPTGYTKTLVVDSDELLASLKRVSLFSSQETSTIQLDLNADGVELKGTDVNFGNSAKEFLTGSYSGDELSIGLNAKYLIDLIQTTGAGKLTLTFGDAKKPVLIDNNTKPDLLQLIMPVAL